MAAPRPAPNLYLMRRITAAVNAAPGGGCSRSELAALVHVHEADATFERSVWACVSKRRIDACWLRRSMYVVAPPRPETRRRGTR